MFAKRCALVVCLCGFGAVGPVVGQTSDEEAILATVAGLFEGLKEGDGAKMRQALEPGARLVQTLTQDGSPTLRIVTMSDFVDRITDYEGPPIEERYWNPEVTVRDNLATLWVEYVFYVGGAIDHCGEDTFQLARTVNGWKILAIGDTQRQTGCIDRS